MRYLTTLHSLFALTAMTASVLATAGTGYNLTATPSIPGMTYSSWTSINNVGDFASHDGIAYVGGQFLSRPNPGWYANIYQANAVNDNGSVAGYIWWYDGGNGSSLGTYTVNNQTTFIRSLVPNASGTKTSLNDLNNAGLAVGTASTSHYDPAPPYPGFPGVAGDYGTHAFRTDGVNKVDIATLGGVNSGGNGINSNGQVVGWSEIDRNSPTRHSFLYARGEVTDLGQIAGNDNSTALDINDAGLIIGNTTLNDNNPWHPKYTRGYIYENGQATLIDALGGDSSETTALNNHGQVVGNVLSDQGYTLHGFLYQNGKTIDLNTLIDPASGWTIRSALDINDRGQILVDACKNGLPCTSMLLAPDALLPLPAVPEPETYAMLLMGLGVLGWSSRRKRMVE